MDGKVELHKDPRDGDDAVSKRTLEENPEEAYLLSLGRITCGYDASYPRLTLSLNRVPFEELKKFEVKLEICRNKLHSSFQGYLWSTTWVLMYSYHQVVVIASLNTKTRTFTLSAGGKNKTHKKG